MKPIIALLLSSLFFMKSSSGNIITESKFVSTTFCENDEDCEDVPKARCLDNYCRCEGNKPCDVSLEVLVTKVGGSCRETRNCNFDGSVCEKGVCGCINGTISSSDGKRCLKLSTGIDDFCDEDAQCYVAVSHSVCIDKLCACEPNRHVQYGECYKTAVLGGFCHSDEECSQTDFSECRENTCSCVKRYVAHENRCFLRAKGLKSTCIEDVQCSIILGRGSHCQNGFCMCKDAFRYKSSLNKCVKNMRYKDKCNVDFDCHESGHIFSRLGCIKGECRCKPYYRDNDGHCKSGSSMSKLSLILVVFISTVVNLS